MKIAQRYRWIPAIALAAMSTLALADAPPVCTPRSPPPKYIPPKPTTDAGNHSISQDTTLTCGSVHIHTEQAGSSDPQTKAIIDRSDSGSWIRVLEAFVKIIGSLAWPVAAAFIGFHLRSELGALFSRLKRGKVAGAEFEFESEIKALAESTPIGDSNEANAVTTASAVAAAKDPRGAIIEIWAKIEQSLLELIKRLDLDSSFSVMGASGRRTLTAIQSIRLAQKYSDIDNESIALFYDLRAMRNEAAHAPDFNPSAESVVSYLSLANNLLSAISKASGRKFDDSDNE